MPLRLPPWLRDALRWRWTPAVALVLGSLLYVLGALLLVPTELSFSSKSGRATASNLKSGGSPEDSEEATAASTRSSKDPSEARRRRALPSARERLDEPDSDQPAHAPEESSDDSLTEE